MTTGYEVRQMNTQNWKLYWDDRPVGEYMFPTERAAWAGLQRLRDRDGQKKRSRRLKIS
ncbi:MAG: hypothetical protein V3S71_02775 [Acidobacteriota bacterium]